MLESLISYSKVKIYFFLCDNPVSLGIAYKLPYKILVKPRREALINY